MISKGKFYIELSLLKNDGQSDYDTLWVLVNKLENRYMAGYLHSQFSQHEEDLLEFLLYETPTYGEWDRDKTSSNHITIDPNLTSYCTCQKPWGVAGRCVVCEMLIKIGN